MEFEIGDLVTRHSHNHDTIFKITDIIDNKVYLKGLYIRLLADCEIKDLKKCEDTDDEEKRFQEEIKPKLDLNRDEYFYLPGKILHIDADHEYLNKCLEYYKQANIWAMGIKESEENVHLYIKEWLEEYNPNIVVITGHDAYYKKNGSFDNIKAYKNSKNFVKSIKEARKFEKSHDKLIIIAGACQSDYEELIRAGANFASSPKRVNIHALDPAIIATKMSLSDVSKDIDLKSIIEKTKYGKNGIGGVITKGTMHIGYPR